MRNTQCEALRKPLPAVLSSLLRVCRVTAMTVMAEQNRWVKKNLTTGEKSNSDFMLKRMTARVWAPVCARQREKKDIRKCVVWNCPDYLPLCVYYNNTTTKKDMSHSRSSVLHNTHDYIQLHFHFISQLRFQLAATLTAWFARRQRHL